MENKLPYKLIITLTSGAILPLVDTTIVSMAIDPLVTYFNVSASIVAWIAISYLLAVVSVIPFTTWLLSTYGSKKIWISGLIIFLTGSLLSGFS
jgi:MFS family permease